MNKFNIRINEDLVTVSEEIYITYYKMGRRERYLDEISKKNNLSYNRLLEKDYPIEAKMSDPLLCFEDVIIEKIMIQKLKVVLNNLNNYERMIIDELFIKGSSLRGLSVYLNIPKSTLKDNKDKILKKLRKMIN